MATTARIEDPDSLASLEERIIRAVQLVTELRKEKDSIQKKMEEALAESAAAVKAGTELQEQVASLTEELETLRAERKQVRTRIEKLLGQMDLFGAS
jgi:predicted nuclease with TOPRIM domain